MIKICPNCKHPQDDARLLVCPTCKVPFAEQTALVQFQPEASAEAIAKALTAGQLDRIAESITKSWKFRLVFVGVLVIGVLLSVPTVMLFTLRHANAEIEQGLQNVREDATRRFDSATNETARRFQGFVETATNQISQAYRAITNHISEELKEPRIRKTVEDVAGTEAKAILEAEVRPTVDRFRADAEFLRLATRARAYDFRAYVRLLDLQKGTNELAHYAEQVVAETDRSLERERSQFMPQRTLGISSGTNLYNGPFASDELAERFASVAGDRTAYNREAFVNAVGNLKQRLFLAPLVRFFTNETDLGVADRATIAISTLANKDFHPHDFERIQTWWRSHENEYTNWPFAGYAQGLDDAMHGNYLSAAKRLEEVVKLDPGADMSRAVAIVSWLEIGETNKAAVFAKAFNLPTARWAKWAKAKLELETGNVTNATVQFVDLTKENPTMEPYLPTEGVRFWRKMDWPLFHKLLSSEKR